MGWRSIIISSPSKLYEKQKQMIIVQAIETSIPIEDISVLIIESQCVTLSSKLLTELALNKVVVYTCNESHLPCGIYTSFLPHSRQGEMIAIQLQLAQQWKNKCWKKIIERKINNQRKVLSLLSLPGEEILEETSLTVQLGDSNNREAVAAKYYFAALLGRKKRRDMDSENAALNYGYAILRGAVARSITSHGFIPAIGIHHKNPTNPFNLADDLMESLRPIVDLWMKRNKETGDQLTKKDRQGLVEILNKPVTIKKEKHNVLSAIETMTASFISAARMKEPELFELPQICDY